jgi:hypothetical protein
MTLDKRISPVRFILVVAGISAVTACIYYLAIRSKIDGVGAFNITVSLVGGLVSALLVGTLFEWLVHRYLMHPIGNVSLIKFITELHHRGHHWVHFRPDRYVHKGPINYIPVLPPQPEKICATRADRFISMSGQALFYLVIGLAVAFVPAWFVTGNHLFSTVFTIVGLVEIYLFVRIHDLVHYPGNSFLERFGWFTFLDRHHYIHHIDTWANTNFLLPLGDILFGSYRTTMTEKEAAMWPSFEEAKRKFVTEEIS